MKRLIIIDLSNFVFRAFYAIRPLTAPDGTPVNAVYGTASMILKIIGTYKPTHLIIANDTPKPTFRKQKFPEYKANRSKPHDDLQVQFPLVNEMMDLMGITRVGLEGYEADDLIATIVKNNQKDFEEVLVASGDKDLMQLVNDKVKILDTQRDVVYTEEKVFEKFGIKTTQIRDYLSILGDSSDNIPGVKGIGKKGAEKLLTEHGSLDGIYSNLESIKSPRTRALLEEYKTQVYLAQDLITLIDNAPIGVELNELSFLEKKEDLFKFLDKINFKSIKEKISKLK